MEPKVTSIVDISNTRLAGFGFGATLENGTKHTLLYREDIMRDEFKGALPTLEEVVAYEGGVTLATLHDFIEYKYLLTLDDLWAIEQARINHRSRYISLWEWPY